MAQTKCSKLVAGWPVFVGVKDAPGLGVGGVIAGEYEAYTPSLSQFKLQANIKATLLSDPGTETI